MVFVEFTTSNSLVRRWHFVGKSLEDVLADTNNGREFGGTRFKTHHQMSRQEAENLQLRFFEEGAKEVERGCRSFKLGLPREI